MNSIAPTRRRRRSILFLLLFLLSSPNYHHVRAFSTSLSSKTPPMQPPPLPSTEPLSSPSSNALLSLDHKSNEWPSFRMRTLLQMISDKGAEPSSTSSMKYRNQSDSDMGDGDTTMNGKSPTVKDGESMTPNNSEQRKISVLDKVSGMFKIPTPNFSLTIPDFFLFSSPKPPKDCPHVDAQLQVDLMESERCIQMLRAEVGLLREQLEYQEDDHLHLQNNIRQAQQRRQLKHAKTKAQQEKLQQKLKQQQKGLKKTQQILEQAQRNATTLEINYQEKLAVQTRNFELQHEQLEHQIESLSAKVTAVTSDYQTMNQTMTKETEELHLMEQTAQTQQDELQQQIADLEASLEEANSTNIQLQHSLSVSNDALQALQLEWQNLISKQNQESEVQHDQEDQVELLQSQNNQTRLALELAETLLEESIAKDERLRQKNRNVWNLEKQELKNQVDSLQELLRNEQLSKEETISRWKAAQTEQDLAQKDWQRQLEKSQSTVGTLKDKLDRARIEYESDLESMVVKEKKGVQALKDRMQSEHGRRQVESQNENDKLREELAKMQQLHEQSEERWQAESTALQNRLTEQLEMVKAGQKEPLVQKEVQAAVLEQEISQLRHENEFLSTSLAQANADNDKSVQKVGHLQKKYVDLRSEYEKWEERVSLMKREFQHAQAKKEELESQLVAATLEKEQSILRAQALEAKLPALAQRSTAESQQHTPRQGALQGGANNFRWAIDDH